VLIIPTRSVSEGGKRPSLTLRVGIFLSAARLSVRTATRVLCSAFVCVQSAHPPSRVSIKFATSTDTGCCGTNEKPPRLHRNRIQRRIRAEIRNILQSPARALRFTVAANGHVPPRAGMQGWLSEKCLGPPKRAQVRPRRSKTPAFLQLFGGLNLRNALAQVRQSLAQTGRRLPYFRQAVKHGFNIGKLFFQTLPNKVVISAPRSAPPRS
jgi:hypothetical protein